MGKQSTFKLNPLSKGMSKQDLDINVPGSSKWASQSLKKQVLWVLQTPTFFRFPAKFVLFFRQILTPFTKFFQILPNFTKFTTFYQMFIKCYPNFTIFLTNLWFTQFCCNLKLCMCFFPPNLYPQKVRVEAKKKYGARLYN